MWIHGTIDGSGDNSGFWGGALWIGSRGRKHTHTDPFADTAQVKA